MFFESKLPLEDLGALLTRKHLRLVGRLRLLLLSTLLRMLLRVHRLLVNLQQFKRANAKVISFFELVIYQFLRHRTRSI